MTKENFGKSFSYVLSHEGGYSNHPKDPGGATNLGVTKKVWEEYVKRPVTIEEMKLLKVSDVKSLYKEKYWDAINGDSLPSGVDHCLFDYAVNSGPQRAARLLQSIAGVIIDGKIGPKTLAAISVLNPVTLVYEICDGRLKFLQSLPTFGTFGKGWTKRVKRVEAEALDLI